MKIAIVGGGIAGLTVARHLHQDHAVTLYEAGDYLGGHANTLRVKEKHQTIAIDSGFIVFNDWTYPHFQSLLASLGVGTDNAEMSFSAKCRASGFEWCGSSISGLVFNRANWRRRKSYQILFDFLRFNPDSTWLKIKLPAHWESFCAQIVSARHLQSIILFPWGRQYGPRRQQTSTLIRPAAI